MRDTQKLVAVSRIRKHQQDTQKKEARAQNPRLLKITFHTLRHWKGTMDYHRTKDILHVKQVLGHKRIENTRIYVQLTEELFRDQEEYVSKVAKTEADACVLARATTMITHICKSC